MPVRIDLDAMSAPKRKTIDADWSPAKKKAVGVAAAVLSVAVLGAGIWWTIQLLPVSMPKSAPEAMAVMNSDKWATLDEARKRDYSEEAWRLINQMPEADRMALLRGKENEEARRNLMMERMAENARKFARGQEMEMPWGRGGPGGPPGGQNGQGRPEGQRPPQDEKTQEQRRQEMVGRIQEGIQSGNAQNMGLMGEMRKRMSGQRGGAGGGRGGAGGPGGGNRGGK
jgi:hypothetical protein